MPQDAGCTIFLRGKHGCNLFGFTRGKKICDSDMEPFLVGPQIPRIQAEGKAGKRPGKCRSQSGKCRGRKNRECHYSAVHPLTPLPPADRKRDRTEISCNRSDSIEQVLLPARVFEREWTVQGYVRVPFPVTFCTGFLCDGACCLLYPPPGPGKTDLDKISVVHNMIARRYRFICGRGLKHWFILYSHSQCPLQELPVPICS